MSLRVKEILKQKGVSQKDLSENTGLSIVTVNKIVQNGNPTVDSLEKVAKYLRVSIKDLFDGDDESNLYIKEGENFKKIGSIKL